MNMHTGILPQGELVDAIKKVKYRKFDLGGPVAYVMRHGGRFIAIYSDKNPDSLNAVWTPPNLGEVITDPDVWNLGGGRLWVGPEFGSEGCEGITYFNQTPGDYGTWVCQKKMDPGKYTMKSLPSLKHGVALESGGKIREFKTGKKHDFTLFRVLDFTKNVKVPHPGVTSASFDYIDKVSSPNAAYFHAWKLLQLYSGDESNPGTLIFPAKEEAQLAVYMNDFGAGLPEFVKTGSDHVSVKTKSMQDTRYKLAITPDSARKTGNRKILTHNTMMHISKVPGSTDRYQLVAMRSRALPSETDEILEVPKDPASDDLPHYLQGDRGACFVYNGPTPEKDSCFTEAEFIDGRSQDGKSQILGSMAFCWGDAEAVLNAAKAVGNMKRIPYVFGLSE